MKSIHQMASIAVKIRFCRSPKVCFWSGVRLVRVVVVAFFACVQPLLAIDYSKLSMADIKKAAKAGDKDAQYALGGLYKLGVEIPKDEDAAKYWYRKAAEQGHYSAWVALGDKRIARPEPPFSLPSSPENSPAGSQLPTFTAAAISEAEFDFLAGTNPTRTPAQNATERYLERLKWINRTYFLSAIYIPTHTDRDMLRRKTLALLELETSEAAKNVPPVLRRHVYEGIAFDIAVQKLWDARLNANDQIAPGLLKTAREVINSSGWDEADRAVERNLFDLAYKYFQLAQAWDGLKALKARRDLHTSWARALRQLSRDGEIGQAGKLYAENPIVTDPTWQFIADQGAGDAFPGVSFNSRRGGKLQPGKLQSLGELSEKPIRIEVRMKSGQWWDQLAVQVAPNVSPRARAVCNAGHLGIALYAEGQMQNENSVWAARGLEEPIYKGISQIDYSYKRPWQCILGILHLPMFTGDGEDRIGGGVVYLYLPGMPSDLPTLDRTARRFILDENGRIKRD